MNKDSSNQLLSNSDLLTGMEHELFNWLFSHRGTLVTRESLLVNVWGFPAHMDTRSVDMCVHRLRTKIGSSTIQTVYGKGYILQTV